MSLISWIRRQFSPTSDFWYLPSGSLGNGVRVSEHDAIKYLTVFSCISLISGDIARLPLNLYKRRKDGGKDLMIGHHLHDLLHNAPNEDTTSFNYRESLQGQLLTWGNCFSFIERDRSGKIISLVQFPDPSQVVVKRQRGQMTYTYRDANGNEHTKTREQIFHVPGYGYNGLVGMSMIGLANQAISLGLATEEFGRSYFFDGTHPAGVVETDKNLGDNRDDFLKSLKDGYAGMGKSHKVMLLEGGMKYKPMTVPLDDAQFLETRNFQKTEICGMYHVPPHKIAIHGENSNYNNLEQENASYVDSCLMHWIVRWESAISQQLLTVEERKQGLFFEFLVQGLLRGDSQARAEYYNKLFQIGGVTSNEIRSKENQNPVEGGDQLFVMSNLMPIDMAREVVEQQKNKTGPLPLPPAQEEKAIRDYFSGERRSIKKRDKIAKIYEPLILDAARAVVVKESKAIKGKFSTRSKDELEGFLDDFYGEQFPPYVARKMGPVLRAYQLNIIDAAQSEIDDTSGEYQDEIEAYVERYVERHVESSHGQLIALLGEDDEAVTERVEQWQETRPEKIASDEAVRASGAAYSFVIFGAGLSLTWRIRGPQTCPYCKELNGRSISKGQAFVQGGTELDPAAGSGPMKVRGIKTHPPLHQGCDCYVST